MDLLGRINHWAAVAPDRPAHLSGERSLTYGELRDESDRLAAFLLDRLGEDRSPVAVVGHKEPEMLIGFLGAVKAGHPYIPLDISTPSQRIAMIVHDAGVKICLTPAEIATIPRRAKLQPARSLAPEDPFYIIFTSGSTGKPKGVIVTLNCLSTFLRWMLHEQRFLEGEEVFLNQAPFSFDLSVMDLYLSLVTGGTLFSIASDHALELKRLYAALARSRLTTWVSTPSFAHLCLVERRFDHTMLPQVRRFLFCGETLTPSVATRLLDRFPQASVWNTYGPTEATVATTSVPIDRELLKQYPILPVGFPMPGTHIFLENAIDGRGEIVIAGDNVSPGYLGSPEQTEQAFFSTNGTRAYRTGDWGRFEDGLLFFEGRMDTQIKLSGYRIELREIEIALCALPEVRDAIVLARKKLDGPASLTSFVICKDGNEASDPRLAHSLRKALAQKLPPYMLPRKFVFLETFPLTANGKADRRQLADLLS